MNLLSLGHACQLYQIDPRVLVVLLEGVQAKPVFTLNAVSYWRLEDMEKAAALDRQRLIRSEPDGEVSFNA